MYKLVMYLGSYIPIISSSSLQDNIHTYICTYIVEMVTSAACCVSRVRWLRTKVP